MSQEWAIVISALISVGGVVISLAVSSIVGYRQRKFELNEHIFFESYQKRLETYKEIIDNLQRISTVDIPRFSELVVVELQEKIVTTNHLVSTLSAAAALFGSQASVRPLKDLGLSLFVLQAKVHKHPSLDSVDQSFNIEVVEIWGIAFNTALLRFLDVVSSETTTNFVDKRIGKTFKKDAPRNKKRNNPHGNSDSKIGD